MQNILIIDDDPAGTQLLITLLELYGHHAHQLGDWKDPLVDLERHHPSLVIMDVHLRSRNGLDLLEEIRAYHDPELACTPILMISADDYRVECKRAGASGFLMKPFTYQALMAAIGAIEEESLL